MDQELAKHLLDELEFKGEESLESLTNRAFKRTMNIALMLGFNKSKNDKEMLLSGIAINGDRYLEAENRFIHFSNKKQSKHVMKADEFKRMSALASLYHAAKLIEILSGIDHVEYSYEGTGEDAVLVENPEPINKAEGFSKEYIAYIVLLGAEMERCFSNYCNLLNDKEKVRLFERVEKDRSNRSLGGKKRSEEYAQARKFALMYANREWAEDNNYPLSKMASDIQEFMESKGSLEDLGLVKLPSISTIKNWIKDSTYRVPRPLGAPKKNNK